jgi:hypothetical protein
MIQGTPQSLRLAAGLTLDRLLRHAAAQRGDQIALIDPPNREHFTAGPPRALTYAQADRAVSAIAARLCGLGLVPDHVVAVQLPNSVEGVLAFLGILRAGLIASPLPLLWRRADCAAALAMIDARAIVTASRIGTANHCEIAMYAAADAFMVRHVGVFGGSHDGMVALDDALDESDAAVAFVPPDRGADAAAHVAAVTWDVTWDATWDVDANGPVPVGRSHAELIMAGLEIMLEARFPAGCVILSSLCLGSLAGIASTLAAWLLSRGTLVLHHPFDPAILRRQIVEHECAAAIVPGSLAVRMAQAGMFRDSKVGKVMAVWRTPQRLAAGAAWSSQGAAAVPLTDVIVFGETGLIAATRSGDGTPAGIRPGASRHNNAQAPVLIEAARTSAGTLALRGPMVPLHSFASDGATTRRLAVDADGFVDTFYPCRFAPGAGGLVVTGPPAGLASVGGYRFAVAKLQDAVSRIDPAAKIAAFPDGLTGQRLAGIAVRRQELQDALKELGHNPLVINAFRKRTADDGRRTTDDDGQATAA